MARAFLNSVKAMSHRLIAARAQTLPPEEVLAAAPPRGELAARLRFDLVTGHSEELLDELQALRYHVFYEEMKATGKRVNRRLRRDKDHHDNFCEHLLARDRANGCIVGAVRLLRREGAQRAGGFLTAKEFNIRRLKAMDGDILEIGRFFMHPAYRRGIATALTWRALVEYIVHHNVRVIFGCASFSGMDADQWAHQLTWLWRHRLAPQDIRPRARRRLYVSMNRDKKTISSASEMPPLPPLLKAYMNVGGFVGDGAVVDKKFNTLDVCVIVFSGSLVSRYLSPSRQLLDFTGKNGEVSCQ